ncbi:MAG: hypothetical protein ACLPTF_00860, partial [Steroidobacteraceae bacterium]
MDNASALPTYPQDQKTTKVSVNLIALEAQQSDPVRHNPDRQHGQPRHSSPYSVSILAAIHTFINEMADLCEKVGADVHDVARGIGLDGSIGRKFLHPGPGFGGSCFP